jgi:hypothetical protein
MKITMIVENTNVENIATVEELILAKSQLQTIDAGYQELGIETPEWVSNLLLSADHEITMRAKGELMKRLRAAKARKSALLSRDEKRAALDAEIAELESKLG